MDTVIITGALGLVGSSIAKKVNQNNYKVIGIDNDYRSNFFPDIGAIIPADRERYCKELGLEFCYDIDISNRDDLLGKIETLSKTCSIKAIIHCAAQPSHDWAAKDPFLDFDINAGGTLNICESMRRYCPEAILIHLSTNKVYGDTPNRLPIEEEDYRYELNSGHEFFCGINETMDIDQSKHSLFGCSKVAADIYVQEYSRYFGIKSIVLRGGCLTGENHRGTKLHGFMNYLIKCAISGENYEIIGYKGKQVRDNLYSEDIADLVLKIFEMDEKANISYPIIANMGGGRSNSISILELIKKLENSYDLKLKFNVSNNPREGDHIWYISDNSVLKKTFEWEPKTSINTIINMMVTKALESSTK